MVEYINWPSNVPVKPVYMCKACAAAVTGGDSMTGHNAYHEAETERLRTMSNVLWCDNGSHAFKKGEPGSQSFVGTAVNEEGVTESIQMDSCAQHAFRPTREITTEA